MAQARTVCRCCWSGCGILVEVEDQQILSVRGDPDHPVSRGYICPKPTALPWWHHQSDRLDEPALRGVQGGWTPVLDDLAKTIERAIGAHGPNAIGRYVASGATADTLGMRALGGFMAALGTKQLYSSKTIDTAPLMRAAELVCGHAMEFLPRWSPEDEASKLVIFIGTNPLVSHGYVTVLADPSRRMKAYQKRGGRIWLLDPQPTNTGRLADRRLAPLPGSDPVVLAWLVREMLGGLAPDAPAMRTTHAEDRARLATALEAFDLDTCAQASGVPADDLLALLADIRAAGRIAVVSGTGLSFGPHGVIGEWLRWALLILTDSLDEPGGMWMDAGWLRPQEARTDWRPAPETPDLSEHPVSRPDLPRFLGEYPCAAMRDEIENGPLRVLLIAGGNPLIGVPDPDGLERAFRSLDALAIYEVVDGPLARLATHLLPAPGQFERLDLGGMFTARPALAEPVVAIGKNRRPMWWVIAKLAQRLGLSEQVMPGVDPDTVTERELMAEMIAHARDPANDLFEAGANGLQTPRPYGWVRRTAVPGGIWRIAPPVLMDRLPELIAGDQSGRPLKLISRRHTRLVNSLTYDPPHRGVEAPDLLMAASDAVALGVTDGAAVLITSDNGSVLARARIRPDLRPGVVSLPHGWHATNVGRLTSDRGVDRLTSQPQMSAIPVSVVLAPAATEQMAPA